MAGQPAAGAKIAVRHLHKTFTLRGGQKVVALQDVDVAARNIESFATMVDALTV